MLNGNIGIIFWKFGLVLYDNNVCIKYAAHETFIDYCNEIPLKGIQRPGWVAIKTFVAIPY